MGFLTNLKTRTPPSRAREYLWADGNGLYLRVRATSKSWLYPYKSGNRQLKLGLWVTDQNHLDDSGMSS